jgi:acetylornithine deacetylase/succinyl-diaminopimelate desuccinylase-like protein
MKLDAEALAFIDRHQEEALDLLASLARIPSPSNHEEKRAAFCKAWLERQGARGVYIDEAMNVVYPIECSADRPLVVAMAHTDVVFPDTEDLPVVIDNGLIKAPGIGDDTANLVALLLAAKYITEKGLHPKEGGMLIVCNSGEEGLGNLRGSRRIIEDFGKRIMVLYSLDGGSGMIVNRSVGSKRYSVEILTEGGHSYLKFGNRNAIAYMASMIDSLYTMKVPETGKTTYNVGMIKGGTSVNTIAQQAEMLYEFRSDYQESLDIMERHFNATIESYRAKGITVNVTLLGERPCMGNVDPDKQQALVDRAERLTREYLKIEPEVQSGSTDCNIPLAAGIPSVALGCYIGEGAHTRGEWLRVDSLPSGLRLAFDLILEHFE